MLLRAVLERHLHLRRRPNLRRTLEDGGTVGPEELAYAASELLDDLILEGHRHAHINLRLAGHLDAQLLQLVELRVDLGDVQQRLGGDAAHVQAGPADVLFLDNRHSRAELRRTYRRDVAARACADYGDVKPVLLRCHSMLLYLLVCRQLPNCSGRLELYQPHHLRAGQALACPGFVWYPSLGCWSTRSLSCPLTGPVSGTSWGRVGLGGAW